jgi:type II secretory pathway pseudopilin PulG
VNVLVVLPVLLVLSAAGALIARQRIRRRRRIRQLESAEFEVSAALDDGRLARRTGEALLQHLEGLRRECSRRDGA